MKKQLSDYPEWVDVNAAVERARMELRAIAEGKAAIETALSKAKRGEADEWEAFKEGGAGEESDGVELRAQYRDLEQRERFMRKALEGPTRTCQHHRRYKRPGLSGYEAPISRANCEAFRRAENRL
jgi:hypothetical protein